MSAAGLRPLRDTLDVCAAELADLARIADALQTTVAVLGVAEQNLRAEMLTDCQAADVLYQRIAGMALFVSRLAGLAPDGVMVDAPASARALPLADQAVRLGGLRRAQDLECVAASDGEMELFDG